MPRFQIDPQSIHHGRVLLDKKESHHAISVLRLKPGAAVELIDGNGKNFHGVVAGIYDGRLDVSILDTASKPPVGPFNDVQITLAVSVIKPERMELLIQKACELGVYSIIPVRSERSIIKLSKERWAEKIKRWQKIAAESCKQCGLAATPHIGEAFTFDDVIVTFANYDQILVPTLSVKTETLYNRLARSKFRRTLVLIGPEGDFSEREVALAVTHGAAPVSLGPLVLRTETAVIYVLSVLSFFYREIRK